MAWMIGSAVTPDDCLDQVRQFTQKEFAAGAVEPGGGNVGDGRVYGASATENSEEETWTLTATSATNFTVVSPSEAGYPDATVGVPYSQAKVSFIIVAEGDAFVATDSFTFDIAASIPEWVQDRWDTDWEDDSSNHYELIQHGIGTGTDEIYVGYHTVTDDSSYWNLLTTGLTGYVAHVVGKDHPLSSQEGFFPYYDCMNDTTGSGTFPFTCIFTSRHIKIIPETVTGEQGSSYVGWFLPFATGSQWLYPMFCGGSSDDADQKVTYPIETDHTCYWARESGSTQASGAVLDMSTWKEITDFNPRSYGYFTLFRSMYSSGDTPLFPCVPIHEGSNNVYGELEGVYYPSPYSVGLLSAGDIVATSTVVAQCFKDVSAGGAGTIIAMDLMGD